MAKAKKLRNTEHNHIPQFRQDVFLPTKLGGKQGAFYIFFSVLLLQIPHMYPCISDVFNLIYHKKKSAKTAVTFPRSVNARYVHLLPHCTLSDDKWMPLGEILQNTVATMSYMKTK